MPSDQSPAKGLKGRCGVCLGVFRLTSDGTVYRHGGKIKGSQCPGSRQPTSTGSLNSVGDHESIPGNGHGESVSQHQVESVGSPDDPCEDSLAFLSAGVRYRLVEHIPKSARAGCGTLLASLLDKILTDPQNVVYWAELLSFGPATLGKPPRGGRKINLVNLIKKRVAEFNGPTNLPRQMTRRNVQRSSSELLAAAVSSKIEQGNLKAAVRIVCSNEAPAPPNAETADKLRTKHSSKCGDRRQIHPSVEECLSVPSSAVLRAIRSSQMAHLVVWTVFGPSI